MLAELWTAAGKALKADRLEVYQKSLGEVPLGLLELASSATRPTGMLRDVAETTDGGLPRGGASRRLPRPGGRVWRRG